MKISKNHVITGLAGFIIFILGFFIGQEYMKYKIASMVSTAISGISQKHTPTKTSKNKKDEPMVIKRGDAHIFSKKEGENLAIKVFDVIDSGKEYSKSYTTIKGNNNIMVVRLEGENVGKKQTFKSISEYSIKLITSDGMEFGPRSVEQVNDRPEGYFGCISCNSNPGEKNLHDILFDIDPSKLDGAKVMLDDDDNVLFEL